jgi:rifampicin phosphotransferase
MRQDGPSTGVANVLEQGVRSHGEALTYVVGLDDPKAVDERLCGGKAATLARLAAAGFTVPGGVVITTGGFAAHVMALDGENSDLATAIRAAPMPGAVAESLRNALADMVAGPLAVRSSCVAEDLPTASFAGQYTTILGVHGFDATVDAVRECWASAFELHVERYRAERRVQAAAMAVLIQPLIDADAAGVAFTANPVTGARDETVVSAVRGLGDRLVSGQSSPDEWVVREDRAHCLSAREGALHGTQAVAVAELARRVERQLGSPQDIEWAIRDGEIFLLQARPITALPPAPRDEPARDVVVPPGFWQRADSHYPRPLSPFARSVLLPAANRGFREMCTEFSLLTETVEEREIGGWVYLRAVPLGGRDRRPPPDWILRLALRMIPSLRARIRACGEAVRTDRAGTYIQQWEEEWRPSLEERQRGLRGVDLRDMTDSELETHAEQIRALLEECQVIHMLLNHSLNLLLAEFAFVCRDLLGWTEERAFEMVIGLSETSSAPARALHEIGERAQRSPELLALLRRGGDGALEAMCAADAAFAASFAAYQREFGCRTIRYEVSDPSLAELPELLLSLIADQLRTGYDPAAQERAHAERRAGVRTEARSELAPRTAAERERFERALARAERAYPVREEHGFFDTMMPLALARRLALELGRRLVERQQLGAPHDIFLLELPEACAALQSGTAQHQLVEQRQLDRTQALSRPGPRTYGTPPADPPSFGALPHEARFAHEAVLWSFHRVFAAGAGSDQQDGTGVLRGIPASAGVFTGPVRVVRDESEFGRLRAGDVLVCPITSPVWSVLFPSIGALVTDTGGFLSHSAIIARESQVPAVVATGCATAILRDGQIVTVDGGAGTVTCD